MSAAMFTAETAAQAGLQFASLEDFRAYTAKMSRTSSPEELDAAVAAYGERVIPQQPKTPSPDAASIAVTKLPVSENGPTPNAQATEPGPLTEKEAIEIVQRWAKEDIAYDEPRTFGEMVEELQYVGEGRTTQISVSRFEEIVRTFAPLAPKRGTPTLASVPTSAVLEKVSYPPELATLVTSGVAFCDGQGFWLLNRCTQCGNFKTKCCGHIEVVGALQYG